MVCYWYVCFYPVLSANECNVMECLGDILSFRVEIIFKGGMCFRILSFTLMLKVHQLTVTHKDQWGISNLQY